MQKASEVHKAECFKMQEPYQLMLKEYVDKIHELETELQKKEDEFQIKEDKLKLALLYIKASSHSCSIYAISNHYLNNKVDSLLNEARKYITTSIVYLEGVFSNKVDIELQHNEDILKYFSEKIDDEWKYNFISSFGYMITYLKYLYGDDSKWKWNFVEVSTRFAIITKNMINYKTYIRDLNPGVEGYRDRIKIMRLNKKLLSESANSYRMKYELTDKGASDIQIAMNILSVLRKIHIYLGETEEANKTKRIYDLWNKKLKSNENNL